MIKLIKPDVRQEDIALAVEVLQSGMLVGGKYVKRLEDKLKDFSQIPFVSCVSSGTAALHLALMAMGIGKNDTVISPAFTFPATANVIEVVGADTSFCDVDPDTYVITPDSLIKKIKELKNVNLKAVIVVHEFGCPARMEELSAICKKNDLFLIEDAACALGAQTNGKHPGFYGDIACFSFHPRKAITTGEGGAVMTRNNLLHKEIHALRNHGICEDMGGRNFCRAGLNYRLTDIQASIAIGQVDRFRNEMKTRKMISEMYMENLGNCSLLELPCLPNGHSLQSFMIKIHPSRNRDKVVDLMMKKGVQTSLGAQALNCLNYYTEKYHVNEYSCPVATNLYKNGLVLPIFGGLSKDDVLYICNTLQAVVQDSNSLNS